MVCKFRFGSFSSLKICAAKVFYLLYVYLDLHVFEIIDLICKTYLDKSTYTHGSYVCASAICALIRHGVKLLFSNLSFWIFLHRLADEPINNERTLISDVNCRRGGVIAVHLS